MSFNSLGAGLRLLLILPNSALEREAQVEYCPTTALLCEFLMAALTHHHRRGVQKLSPYSLGGQKTLWASSKALAGLHSFWNLQDFPALSSFWSCPLSLAHGPFLPSSSEPTMACGAFLAASLFHYPGPLWSHGVHLHAMASLLTIS